MKVIKRTVKTSCVIALLGGSSVFAQNLAEAKKAIDAEQYQKAQISLKSLVASQSGNAENYFYLGKLYLNQDYPDSAKAVFTSGISKDPKFASNYVGLGAVDLSTNNTAAAKVNFDKAISLASKKDNDPYIFVGKAYIAAPKPDYATAITYIQKAVAMDEKDAEAYLALGDAYRGQAKNNEAFGAYRSASDLDKNLLRAQLELGIITKRAGAWPEAIAAFNNVLKVNANYGPAHREIAETYLRWANKATESKDYEEKIKLALTSYVKYMDLTDHSLESRMRYADFLVLSKDYKTLEKEAQEMAKLDKTNPRIYRYLGYSAFENGNYPGSIQAINDFMTKAGTSRVIPLDYLYLAKAQLKSGDVPAGLANLKKASALDSTASVEGLNTIAKEFYMAKKYDLAAQVYDVAQASPNADLADFYYQGSANYWDYATKFNAKANPSKEILVKADTAYSRLLQRSPTTEAAWLGKAKVAQLMDDANQSNALAAAPYQKYIELVTVTKPEKAEKAKSGLVEAYNYLAAVSAIKDKNNSKAKEYYNKTLQLDPSNRTAQEGLKSLAVK